MWGFHTIREKALTNLSASGLDPVDQIILAKKYDVQSWLIPALQVLAQNNDPVGFKDALRLSEVVGWEFTLKIGHIREAYSATPGSKFCDLNWNCGNCGQANHTIRCASHNLQLVFKKASTEAIPWPCASCTTYYCIHTTGYAFTKPATSTSTVPVPRSNYDFTSAIRKEFGINE